MNAGTMPRHRDWLRRFAEGHGFAWGELWADVRSHPDYPTWQQLARQRGLAPDEELLGYHMTRGLILEVIHAAGGVERELAQVQAALEEAQAWADQAVLNFPSEREKPLRGVNAAAPSLVDVSYAFVNLLIWARTVRERVERPWRPRSTKRVGLLPALEPGPLQDRVADALSILDDALGRSPISHQLCATCGESAVNFHPGCGGSRGRPHCLSNPRSCGRTDNHMGRIFLQ
jgi:hypothetical protein